MKQGVKAFCLAVVIACGITSYPTLAAQSTSKAEAATAKAEGTSTVQAKEKAVKANDSEERTVSINTASADELAAALNGVGMKKAQAIVNYRDENGPFNSVDDLKQVPGMGNSLVERNLARIKL
ncbi:helix-hairpin-helix domain-containing protein [Atlantibacter sp.]|uniref:ComEA family DNA-binding protein n=1 Tax=Atlantibacter sp. TaxID=1903473 RepID=UPI0028985996|nr:helix-hairpin-helix domain-containing protein [Atlantibacter sp.]